jgi:cytoskeletal protein CcmA (bactofilin family)
MFDQSAEQPASEPSAPLGMREMPPQPARPVMPAYTLPSATAPGAASPRDEDRSTPGADDSVIAQDDHVEGTFTSRGTVVVMGSLKGRIEAMRVRIEQGANVDADVIVDEAIVAGEFKGNLTCRERLEARPTGRINGKVETFKLMLHEGASVEGEMHMLTERPRDAAETIRGSAPLRGETADAKASARAATAGSHSPAPEPHMGAPASSSVAAAAPAPPATRPAPVVAPSSSAKARTPAAQPVAPTTNEAAAPRPAPSPSQLPSVEAILATRSTAAQTLRIDGLRVPPRTATSGQRPSGTVSGSPVSSGSRTRNGTTNSAF